MCKRLFLCIGYSAASQKHTIGACFWTSCDFVALILQRSGPCLSLWFAAKACHPHLTALHCQAHAHHFSPLVCLQQPPGSSFLRSLISFIDRVDQLYPTRPLRGKYYTLQEKRLYPTQGCNWAFWLYRFKLLRRSASCLRKSFWS